VHVEAVDLDHKVERHDTYNVLLMARNSIVYAVKQQNGEYLDLRKYFGAWVTPHAEPVQALLREVADKLPKKVLAGYPGGTDPEQVTGLVKAVFDVLKEKQIVYVNSVVSFGTEATQRTRLPRESLRNRSANCIDGTVLMASVLEAVSVRSALVFVPGHAFLAWEKIEQSNVWDYVETTMIGTNTFEEARSFANQSVAEQSKLHYPTDGFLSLRMMEVDKLRSQYKVWPME